MDGDRKDLVQHHFSLATEIAESAHETAGSAQTSSMPAVDFLRAADMLNRYGGELQSIAQSIRVAIGQDLVIADPIGEDATHPSFEKPP